METKIKRERRIWVTDDVTRQLMTEFEVSNPWLLICLRFASHSVTALKIRERAIELMKTVNEENEKLMEEYHSK